MGEPTGAEPRRQRSLEKAAGGDTTGAMMIRELGLAVAKSIVAFGREDWAHVIDQLAPAREISNRFGGSHAQRDVLSLTLIEAALRGGRDNLARHLLAERTVLKPASALGWQVQARAK